jgi:hypothetical protein
VLAKDAVPLLREIDNQQAVEAGASSNPKREREMLA